MPKTKNTSAPGPSNAQVSRLCAAVERMTMTTQPAPGQRKTRRRRRRGANSGNLSAPLARPINSSGQGAGLIRVKHVEVFGTIAIGAATAGKPVPPATGTITLCPTKAEFKAGHLRALAKIYERLQFHSVRIEYRPVVGTTQGGVILMGFDYDNEADSSPTIESVTAKSPNMQCAIWGSLNMAIPLPRLQPQRWLSLTEVSEAAFGALTYYATGPADTTVGYLRIAYDVSLAGTRL